MLRLALILLFAFVFYSPESSAQNCSSNSTNPSPKLCGSQGQAYSECQAAAAEFTKLNPTTPGTCRAGSSADINQVNSYYCGNTGTQRYCGYSANYVFDMSKTCSASGTVSGAGQYNSGEQGDIKCFGGCVVTVNQTADTFTLNASGAVCALATWGPSSCPANYIWSQYWKTCSPKPPDADGDGIPDSEDLWPTDPNRAADSDQDGVADGFDKFPNDPTEAFDQDLDGVGDNADNAPTDPTNGKDNGLGTEKDNTSTGGASCNSPPVSSGDGITSQIAFQTWATRCAAEKTNDKLDEVKAAINAQGEPVVNVTVTGTGGSGSIDGDVSGMTLDEGVTGITGGSGNVQEVAIDDAEFDSSGFLGGDRSCPEFPVLDVMGATLDFNVPHLCTFFEIGASLVLLFAAVAGLRIIGGA